MLDGSLPERVSEVGPGRRGREVEGHVEVAQESEVVVDSCVVAGVVEETGDGDAEGVGRL